MLNGKGAYAQSVRVGDQSNQERFAHPQSGIQDLLSRILRKCLTPFALLISEDEKSNSVCKIDLRSVLLRAPRLWLKANLITSVNVFVSILLYAFLAIGFSRAATAQIYYEPGINPYREQASQDGIESVDPYSGILKIRNTDLFLPGNGGLDIKVSRFYDSANVTVLGVGDSLLSAMGNGWTFHFGKLTGSYVCRPEINNSSSRSIFELPDGTQYKFGSSSNSL